MTNKSSKGPNWERKFAKDLSLWWTEGIRNDIFWRSSQSGGRATQRSKKGLKTAGSYGDITALDPIGIPLTNYFLIELKRGYTKDIGILDMLDGNKSIPLLIKFWKKCEIDRISAGREENIIIFRRDYKNPVIMIRFSFYVDLKRMCGIPDPFLSIITTKHSDHYGVPTFQFMLLDEWFAWIDPKKLLRFIRNDQE